LTLLGNFYIQFSFNNSPYANFFENLFSDFQNHKIMWFDRKTKFRKRLILKESKFQSFLETF